MPSEAKKIARSALGRVGAGGGVGAAEAAGTSAVIKAVALRSAIRRDRDRLTGSSSR